MFCVLDICWTCEWWYCCFTVLESTNIGIGEYFCDSKTAVLPPCWYGCAANSKDLCSFIVVVPDNIGINEGRIVDVFTTMRTVSMMNICRVQQINWSIVCEIRRCLKKGLRVVAGLGRAIRSSEMSDSMAHEELCLDFWRTPLFFSKKCAYSPQESTSDKDGCKPIGCISAGLGEKFLGL